MLKAILICVVCLCWAVPAYAQNEEPRLALAVVAFQAIPANSPYAYLKDGLPEAITAQLVKIPQLDVLTRSQLQAVLKEQGFGQSAYVDPASAPRIGQLVGARYLLTGSFQVQAQDLLLQAQLIDVESGKVVFAEPFKASLKNPLKLQGDVARHLVDKLSLKLEPKVQAALATASLKNEKALKHYVTALQAIEQEHWQQARDALLQSLELELGFIEAHQYLLEVSAKLEQVPALLNQYQAWVQRKDCPAIVWNYLGNVQVARKAWPEAEKAYQQVLAKAPDFVPVYNNLGVLAILSQQDYPGARTWFHKALRLNPLEPITHYNLGKWHFDQKQHEQGQNYFRKALELSHGKFLDEIQDALFGGELKIYGQAKTLPGGQIIGEVILKRNSEAPVTLLEIHDDLGGVERVNRARIVASRLKYMLFELVPDNIVSDVMNHENVVQTRNQGKLIVTVGVEAAERLGLSREDLAHQWAKTLAYYLAYEGTTYRTKAGAPTLPQEVQYLQQGDQLYQQRRYHEALAAYQQAVEVKWRLFSAHYSMGMIYMELGEYAKAEHSFENILRVDPTYVQAHLALGELYFRTAHYEESRKFLLRVLELDANNLQAQKLLKEIH